MTKDTANSLLKYAQQAVTLLTEAPFWQWPSMALYMIEVVIYRVFGKRLRESLELRLYGLTFNIKTHNMDLGIIYEIFAEGVYQTHGFMPRDGWTCIDVGANIGCVSLNWAKQNRNGMIYAIEPHPETFQRLYKNIKANRFSNIKTFNIAASNKSGSLEFAVFDRSSMGVAMHLVSSPTYGDHPGWAGNASGLVSCRVPAQSLDDFCKQQGICAVDLLKIDVEGHEVLCLQGAIQTLCMTCRIILEYHSPSLRAECCSILREAGFLLTESVPLIFGSKSQ
jgi:FkbM family methyltransferase